MLMPSSGLLIKRIYLSEKEVTRARLSAAKPSNNRLDLRDGNQDSAGNINKIAINLE